MSKLWKFILAAATFAPLTLSVSASAAEPSVGQMQQGWRKVDNKRVCMVTDMVFPRDQIPVQVGDKTYYGCCQNCKSTLSNDDKVRFALDPVTGKKVDKATAVIGAGPDGSVAYFENEANLEKFASTRKSP